MFGFLLVIPLMLIIITGNLLRRYGFYDENDIHTLIKTLYWIVLPPLLFRTTFISGKEVLTQHNLLIAINICYLLTIFLTWLWAEFIFHKNDRDRIAVSTFAAIRSNNVYLGFPVMALAAGESGLHNASVYFAVSIVTFQIYSITAGEVALSGKLTSAGFMKVIKKLLVNPLIISCVAGVTVALCGLEKLPVVLDEAMKLMGGAATAVALLALGGTLDLSRVSGFVRILRETWIDCAIKLVLHPALMLLLFYAFPVPKPLVQATVMLSSMPTAINCFILAKEMQMDAEYCANLVAATTVLGSVSIPFWAYVLGLV